MSLPNELIDTVHVFGIAFWKVGCVDGSLPLGDLSKARNVCGEDSRYEGDGGIPVQAMATIGQELVADFEPRTTREVVGVEDEAKSLGVELKGILI